eukprot:12235598-Alexandrium_andersonii.AAC.1
MQALSPTSSRGWPVASVWRNPERRSATGHGQTQPSASLSSQPVGPQGPPPVQKAAHFGQRLAAVRTRQEGKSGLGVV